MALDVTIAAGSGRHKATSHTNRRRSGRVLAALAGLLALWLGLTAPSVSPVAPPVTVAAAAAAGIDSAGSTSPAATTPPAGAPPVVAPRPGHGR